MNIIKKAGIGIAGLLALLSIESKAQDFFNGMPGPKLTQSDCYFNLNLEKDEASGLYVQKVFPKLSDNSKLLIASPISITKIGFDQKGINLGYMRQKIFGKEIYATFAAGAFEGPSSKLTQLTPQTYITLLQDKFSLDLEGAINFNTESGNVNKRGALTLGYGNDRFRFGGSAIFQDGQKPSYQLLGRIDLTADHKYWAEIYAMNNKTIKIRFAANF